MIRLNLDNKFMRRYDSHITDEETNTQRGSRLAEGHTAGDGQS